MIVSQARKNKDVHVYTAQEKPKYVAPISSWDRCATGCLVLVQISKGISNLHGQVSAQAWLASRTACHCPQALAVCLLKCFIKAATRDILHDDHEGTAGAMQGTIGAAELLHQSNNCQLVTK